MRRIILASKSEARRKLLRQIGLKVIVVTTHVEESRSLKNGCSYLVVKNAVAKAQAAAKKYDTGVVIAADTVVLVKGRVIGKPKNIKEAQRIIHRLVKKPHWVYTGLVVIDIDSGRMHTAWEKTKVYMSSLNSRQIKDYCRNVLPFDKAGAFDIQGRGGLFVERIEGCFYNVVGLPLAQLVKILRKVHIDIFNL